MTEAAGWIRSLAAAAIICAACEAVCPAGRTKKMLRLVCGVVMAVVLIEPLCGLDFDAYATAAAKYGEAASQTRYSAEETSDRLNRTIIEQECAAYILDKAAALGVSVSCAGVRAQWSTEGCWVPWEATLTTPEYSSALAETIEAELGIPGDRQHWEVSVG